MPSPGDLREVLDERRELTAMVLVGEEGQIYVVGIWGGERSWRTREKDEMVWIGFGVRWGCRGWVG